MWERLYPIWCFQTASQRAAIRWELARQRRCPSALGEAAAADRADLHIWTRLKSWTFLFQPTHHCPLLYNWDGCGCLCLSDNVNICLPTAKVTPIWLLPLCIHFCGSLSFMLLLNLTMDTLLPCFPFISDEPQNGNLKVAHTFLQVLNILICLNSQSFDGKGNNMMFME